MRRMDLVACRRRAHGAGWFTFLVLVLLAGSFFRTQVVRGDDWTLQSDSNRLRVLSIPSPRGTIFDRHGEIVAENSPAFTALLFPASPDSIALSLEALAPILELSATRRESLMAQFRANPRQPLVVKRDLSDREVAIVEERRSDLTGVFLELAPRRRYVGGEALGHVLGYVGEISAGELESPRFSTYTRGMLIGKDGLERQYEERLQGVAGVWYAEVDALGRVLGAFQGRARRPPEPGESIHLHLDLALQRYVHGIFPEGMRGAVVILNVEDGGVLALYSAPSFDPGEFVGGITPERWQAFNEDPAQPLFNRAVVGRYPPASTWKLATAAIALEAGVVSPDEAMPSPCNGAYTFQGRTARCHLASGHGYQTLVGAIATSCNVYFYQLGQRVGLERMVAEGHRLGFGDRCGIDLPRESAGIFPDSPDYWLRTWGYRPSQNEVMTLAIGHGPNDQTPLRMAQFYLALARNGDAPVPRLVRGEELDQPAWTMDLAPENLESLRDGLRAVTRPGGTAFLRASVEHWDVIGKTGTARLRADQPPHAWFAGMAGPWGSRPEIVMVVMVEEGESGSARAAPVAAKAADFYLRRKYDIPVDTIQTLWEHQRAGVPAPWAWNRQVPRSATAPVSDAVAAPESLGEALDYDPAAILGPRPPGGATGGDGPPP